MGPASDIVSKDGHPVVHVSWDDEVANATSPGERLPTEAEWGYIARRARGEAMLLGGDEPVSLERANVWQGRFPDANTGEDGYRTTYPVWAFPPNGNGFYGTAGNVWEWCGDLYRPDASRASAARGVVANPGALERLRPSKPEPTYARAARRVVPLSADVLRELSRPVADVLERGYGSAARRIPMRH